MRRKPKYFLKSLAMPLIVIMSLTICAVAQSAKRKHHPVDRKLQERQTIAYAKKYLVSDIEPNVPQITFAEWFQKTVGETKKVSWEINDCGEQTGTSADRGRDFPMCVEAKAELAAFFYASVNLQVGQFKRGISRDKPVARSIVVGEEMGGEWVETLAALPDKIKSSLKTLPYIDPNGVVFKISGEPPAGLENLLLKYSTRDYYKSFTPIGDISAGDTFYRLKSLNADLSHVNIETQKVKGIAFEFKGEFTKLKFAPDGSPLTLNVLRGHLIKFVNGVKRVEADLSFDSVPLNISTDNYYQTRRSHSPK